MERPNRKAKKGDRGFRKCVGGPVSWARTSPKKEEKSKQDGKGGKEKVGDNKREKGGKMDTLGPK